MVEEIESSIFQILNCGKVRLFDSLNPTEIISLLAPEECWDEKDPSLLEYIRYRHTLEKCWLQQER